MSIHINTVTLESILPILGVKVKRDGLRNFIISQDVHLYNSKGLGAHFI